MINGIDVSNPTRNFTADEWTSLGWNGEQVCVAKARERMNGIGYGGRGGGHDVGREYGCGGGLRNVNELNSNNSCGHDEGQQVGQGQGQGHRAVHGRDKGGRNGTGFGRGDYH